MLTTLLLGSMVQRQPLLVLQWTIALSPPPLLTHRMRGTLRVPYALAILLLRVLTEVLQLQYR